MEKRISPRGISWDLIGKGETELEKFLAQADENTIQNLTSLNIRENELQILPSYLNSLKSLKILNLSANKWESQNLNEISSMNWANSLTSLDIGNSSLEQFPVTIYQLTNLRQLFAHGNLFKYLPEIEEGCLTNLEVLNLNYNKLNSLPDSIVLLKNLRQLCLFHNNLPSLPPSFERLNKLELVQLQGNPSFEGIPEEVRISLKSTKIYAPLPDEVISGKLFIGDFDVALNSRALKKKGITHILSICEDAPNIDPKEFKHKVILLDDSPNVDIMKNFEECHLFIEEGTTLVHCVAGISRSATVVISYIMQKLDKTPSEALKILQSVRPIVCPNEGFISQLTTYEDVLKEQRNRDASATRS